jgi:hypothetical protein
MVQTTNPKGAAKAEVASIIPWLQVRVLPVLLGHENGGTSEPPAVWKCRNAVPRVSGRIEIKFNHQAFMLFAVLSLSS